MPVTPVAGVPHNEGVNVSPKSGSVIGKQTVTGVLSFVVTLVPVMSGLSFTGVIVTGTFAVSQRPVWSQTMIQTVSSPLYFSATLYRSQT